MNKQIMTMNNSAEENMSDTNQKLTTVQSGNQDLTAAIILAAGVGARIRPLTDNLPKSLLTINDTTILERMISNIQECGLNEIVVVLGYLEEQIRDFISATFPDLKVTFIVNERYTETNTAYSLMLAANAVEGRAFVKFDADVVFDKEILKQLIASDSATCLCVDTNIQLDAEEIKVAVDENMQVTHASKTLNPLDAIGESIGIEKISADTAQALFHELRLMMEDHDNHQDYYESAYERLIEQEFLFFALDITGLKWIEIDTAADFSEAANIFQTSHSPSSYVPHNTSKAKVAPAIG